MRKARLSVALAFALVVVPLVMGAGQITLVVTPNPGGAVNRLKGNGTWGVGVGEQFYVITFQTTLKGSNPPQLTGANAVANGAPKFDWESTLIVAPATYNPTKATLQYFDNAKKLQMINAENQMDQKVK